MPGLSSVCVSCPRATKARIQNPGKEANLFCASDSGGKESLSLCVVQSGRRVIPVRIQLLTRPRGVMNPYVDPIWQQNSYDVVQHSFRIFGTPDDIATTIVTRHGRAHIHGLGSRRGTGSPFPRFYSSLSARAQDEAKDTRHGNWQGGMARHGKTGPAAARAQHVRTYVRTEYRQQTAHSGGQGGECQDERRRIKARGRKRV